MIDLAAIMDLARDCRIADEAPELCPWCAVPMEHCRCLEDMAPKLMACHGE